MAELSFVRRNSEAIVTGLAVCAIWGLACFLYGKYPTLLPLLSYLLVCGGMTFVVCAAVIALRRIPKPPPTPTMENIENYVRAWLDNHRITVTKDPSDSTYFRYRIKLSPDNEELTIFRMRNENPEYVQVWTDLGLKGDDGQKLLNQFNEEEISRILFDIKLELARAKVGYSGLVMPPTDFKLSRKVLIHSGLREPEFLSAIYDIEAAMHIVMLIYLRVIQEKGKQSDSSSMRQFIADTPVRELPPASS